MNPLSPHTLWLTAYANPPGVKIRVTDAVRAKNLLYTARRELRDPDLMFLELRTSPTDPVNELWLINPGSPPSEPEKVFDMGEI